MTLLPQYVSPPSNDYNGWHFAQPSIRNQFKEYVTVWIQPLNCAIMGKVLKKSLLNDTVTIQHFSILPIYYRNYVTTEPCKGCHVSGNRQTDQCLLIVPRKDTAVISATAVSNNNHRRFNINFKEYSLYAHRLFCNNRKRPSSRNILRLPSNDRNNNIITRYFDFSVDRNNLIRIQEQFKHSSSFIFYTDGSLIDLSLPSCSMSFGFVQIETSSPQITFTSTTSLWPSSCRAEVMAILSTIISVPKDATIDIFTDSKSSINVILDFPLDKLSKS